MQKHKNKGLLLFLTGVLLSVCGIAGMVFFIIRIKNYPGQSMPGKEILGAFVLSPTVMFTGIIMAIRASQNYSFVTGRASNEKVKRRVIIVLIFTLLVSTALVKLLHSTFSIIIAAILIAASICSLLRMMDAKIFLKACYLTALAETIVVLVLLNMLPSAPGGTVLIVNGWYRSYMSHRSADIIGTVLILAVGPLLLAWPLALLAGGLYNICTWELH